MYISLYSTYDFILTLNKRKLSLELFNLPKKNTHFKEILNHLLKNTSRKLKTIKTHIQTLKQKVCNSKTL